MGAEPEILLILNLLWQRSFKFYVLLEKVLFLDGNHFRYGVCHPSGG